MVKRSATAPRLVEQAFELGIVEQAAECPWRRPTGAGTRLRSSGGAARMSLDQERDHAAR